MEWMFSIFFWIFFWSGHKEERTLWTILLKHEISFSPIDSCLICSSFKHLGDLFCNDFLVDADSFELALSFGSDFDWGTVSDGNFSTGLTGLTNVSRLQCIVGSFFVPSSLDDSSEVELSDPLPLALSFSLVGDGLQNESFSNIVLNKMILKNCFDLLTVFLQWDSAVHRCYHSRKEINPFLMGYFSDREEMN